VFKFYVLVVGAIFASSALIQRFDPWMVLTFASSPILLCGLAILGFDAIMAGKAEATAAGMKERLVAELPCVPPAFGSPPPSPHMEGAPMYGPPAANIGPADGEGTAPSFFLERVPEEFLFGFIVIVINAAVLAVLSVALWPFFQRHLTLPALLFLPLQTWFWFHISRRIGQVSIEWSS
jgi:hypothetical protein